MDILLTVTERKKIETKERYIEQAFGAWQVIEGVKALLGGNEGTSFEQYLIALGLRDEEVIYDEKKLELEAQKGISIAEQIKALDLKQQKEGGQEVGNRSI